MVCCCIFQQEYVKQELIWSGGACRAASPSFIGRLLSLWGRLRNFGVCLTQCWVCGFGWCCRLSLGTEMGQWWACKCHGFSYSSFEASVWDDLVGSLTPLSCNSNSAWSWEQWKVTPFKNTSSYYCSGEVQGPVSVATAWVLLFLLSSSPGFWRPFNSPLYLVAACNSQSQHCVLCICWQSHFLR